MKYLAFRHFVMITSGGKHTQQHTLLLGWAATVFPSQIQIVPSIGAVSVKMLSASEWIINIFYYKFRISARNTTTE